MNEKEKEQEQKYLEAVDVSYSYGLAKAMERIKSNPVLGFRTAGSRAEYETGEMLRQEMERIGLEDIHKDRLCLDGWEFEKAVLRFRDAEGAEHVFQLGAYQTQFLTGGFQKFPLVYVGRGGAQDYAGRDVRGCLVLVDINQRDEWWINFPVYQAHLKGAAAVIAVQDNGYGEIDGEALNAQDIAGPKDAPAFSISQKDAAVLKEALQKEERLTVEFDASSRILEQTESYNIWGTIPGREEDMILLSAHYDSYYDGFQDDNCAVAMMLGIARALLETGYRPRKTLVFCAMAAEEWGIVNSKYDWSTGAWQQVFKLRPDWPGKVIADLNFELPAYAHNAWDAIRSTYEYEDFLKEFVEKLPVDPTNVYPQGLRVHCPIETWSDDFSMAISGIPSIVLGLFAYSFLVRDLNLGRCIFSAGVALAVMILPFIEVRAEKAFREVPAELVRSSYSLGCSKLYTITRIVLPACRGELVSGIILGGCYAMGATAPMIFTGAVAYAAVPDSIFSPAMALPLHLYLLVAQGSTSMDTAYGTAFVMMAMILLSSLLATAYARRSQNRWKRS